MCWCRHDDSLAAAVSVSMNDDNVPSVMCILIMNVQLLVWSRQLLCFVCGCLLFAFDCAVMKGLVSHTSLKLPRGLLCDRVIVMKTVASTDRP